MVDDDADVVVADLGVVVALATADFVVVVVVVDASHPIGRVVGRRPICLRSGDTGSKPPGVPCGVAQSFCAALGPFVSGV